MAATLASWLVYSDWLTVVWTRRIAFNVRQDSVLHMVDYVRSGRLAIMRKQPKAVNLTHYNDC